MTTTRRLSTMGRCAGILKHGARSIVAKLSCQLSAPPEVVATILRPVKSVKRNWFSLSASFSPSVMMIVEAKSISGKL